MKKNKKNYVSTVYRIEFYILQNQFYVSFPILISFLLFRDRSPVVLSTFSNALGGFSCQLIVLRYIYVVCKTIPSFIFAFVCLLKLPEMRWVTYWLQIKYIVYKIYCIFYLPKRCRMCFNMYVCPQYVPKILNRF